MSLPTCPRCGCQLEVKQASTIERVLVQGDLAQLKPEDRITYYRMVCESVGLNPLTKPFEYITLNGKLTLYARKDATDQLRNIHQLSIIIVAREVVEECYVVTARATNPAGRTDESIGAVPIGNLKGDARCNSMMKAETKAKRRVTLSMCGLGMLDETEIETIPSAKPPVQRTTEDIPVIPVARLVTSEVVEPETEPEIPGADCIDEGRAKNFHIEFKKNLRKEIQKQADELATDWLRAQGIKDITGKPSAYAIKKANFEVVRDSAVEHAKSL